jgi:succinyl-CoA synthetase beta subunit
LTLSALPLVVAGSALLLQGFLRAFGNRRGGKVVGVLAPANAERTHSGRGYVQNLDGRFSGEADMQMSGMLYGARLLAHVDFPAPEVLGPGAREDDIQGLIDRHKTIFIKPQFKGGVGKKSKAGLIGTACDLKTALQQKERLYFAEHRDGLVTTKANGVTFEAAVRAEHEIYFAIGDSTEFRAPTMTLTHFGGVDIEELDPRRIARIPFEALTGLKAFVVANALTDIGAPKEVISPLVQHLPKLWELVHHYGMTTLELNPIRMRPEREGRLTPVACDFKCGFDRDDPRWARLDLPGHLLTADASEFEHEVNELRTHQGQSDVFVINPKGSILAPTFGGGANSLVTEVLGEAAIISSDFGGNPPYEKMKAVASICYKHWLQQANVLFIIGGKSNNTDIYETFRAMADALREHFSQYGPTPLYVVVGRGGPNLVRGMGAVADTCDSLGIPYRFFGFDSAISEVVNYAKRVDAWMQAGGRKQIAAKLGLGGI